MLQATNQPRSHDIGRWSTILSAITAHQNKNHGFSPPNHIISRDTHLSLGQVEYHLKEMEQSGLIVDMKGWPRRIVVRNPDKVAGLSIITARPIEEVKVTKPNYPKKDFFERAKQVAQIIMNQYKETGRAPSIRDVTTAVGYSHGGSMSNVIKRMKQNGWIWHEHRRHGDLAITGLGASALLGMTETPAVATPNIQSEPIAQPEKPVRKQGIGRKEFYVRAKQIAQAVMDHIDAHGIPPSTGDIAKALGMANTGSTSSILNKMVERGWLFHKKGYMRDITLTALGRALVFGEVREDVDTNTPVHSRLPTQRGWDNRKPPEPVFRQPEVIVEVRRATPEPEPAVEPVKWEVDKHIHVLDLSAVDTVDLLLELQSRGLKVSR